MGPTLCTAIAGFHASTGFDYTASFLNKGKVRPLALMDKSVKFMTTFGKLGESSFVPPKTIEELETYVCNMYQAQIKFSQQGQAVAFQLVFCTKKRISTTS